MDSSSFEGFVLDPQKCSKLSTEEKRELVYEISKWSHGGSEMLQSWSRREILQILCAEMGKERKYTGLSKNKLIDSLFRIVSEKSSGRQMDSTDVGSQPLPAKTRSSSKRQRKTDHPSRLAIGTNQFAASNGDEVLDNTIYCKNLACRAVNPGDTFCKRCSCCICYQYDDNKDPSLWLVCSSEPFDQGYSCGLSCHLECALKHERAGILKNGHGARLDGNFYCVSCRKVNDLLGCWRKQLIIAKDARRVDILCYRVSLAHKILSGTEKYQELHKIVGSAIKQLEAEIGPLDGLPVKMARGIVNRLSCGAEIQKSCASAVVFVDSMLSSVPQLPIDEATLLSPDIIGFEGVSPTSVTVVLGSEDIGLPEELVGYKLWCKRADITDYPKEPTCTLFRPNRRFLVSDLIPDKVYMFKVISFSQTRELGWCETKFSMSSDTEGNVMKGLAVESTSMDPHSNPSSEGDESHNNTTYDNQNSSPDSYVASRVKLEIPDLGKLSDYARKEPISRRIEAVEKKEMPRDLDSAVDKELIKCEIGSAPPDSTDQTESQKDSTDENQATNIPQSENKHNSEEVQLLEEVSIDNESNGPTRNSDMDIVVPFEPSDSVLPVTPCKMEIGKEGSGRSGRTKSGTGEPVEEPHAGSSSKKRTAGRCEEMRKEDETLERDYEYCVKVIRWLECQGHMEKNFRVKFLTWFSLRATPQERRIVSVYVDTLIDDPASLAGQLVDTFSENICRKKPQTMPTGFCMRLWH
eukprot:TRINITY_DN16067_c0_g1_i1.p1 TRINITY_DN16067_c0_g1~~TRINITY_DN16067_c0_g1_i1.p1  ORF type:complete len:749 (-),score=135.70 TRINITY_DN16067_c0_g1_i1:127-2373(-)